jgi:hypothetical protein
VGGVCVPLPPYVEQGGAASGGRWGVPGGALPAQKVL